MAGAVSGNDFSAQGPDILGMVAMFEAPRSTTVLNGTWAAGRANATFVVTKQ